MSGLPGLSYSDDIVPPSPKRMRIEERQDAPQTDIETDEEDFYNDGTPAKNALLTLQDPAQVEQENDSPNLLRVSPSEDLQFLAGAPLPGKTLAAPTNINGGSYRPSLEKEPTSIEANAMEVDDFYEPPAKMLPIVHEHGSVDSLEIREEGDGGRPDRGTENIQCDDEPSIEAEFVVSVKAELLSDDAVRPVIDARPQSLHSTAEEILEPQRFPEERELEPQSQTKLRLGVASNDTEFQAAATANKIDAEAEWRYDSSDADSSEATSSDETSSDDSDEDSEDEAKLLDAKTQARMLLEAIGDEDEPAPTGPLRTVNEKDEEILPKPDINLTPDMKITELGHVENFVGSFIVIKGTTTGTYQVVEAGSALCTEDRTVIGAVMEPMARVQQPMYSMGFADIKELEQAGVARGTKIFYVDAHSTFVFTQPLKALKGTDASNIHDEEPGREEAEFSDDEKEAAYKRESKRGKGGRKNDLKGGREHDRLNNLRSTRGGHPDDISSNVRNEAIRYEDDEEDEIYRPLKRPDNLHNDRDFPSMPSARGRGRGGFADRGGRGRGRERGGRGGSSNDHGGMRSQRNAYHQGQQAYTPDRRHGSQSSPRNGSAPPHNQRQQNLHEASIESIPSDSYNAEPQSTFAGQYDHPGYMPSSSMSQQPNYGAQQMSFNPMALLSMLPAGAHLNPAVFAQNLMNLPNIYSQAPPPPVQRPNGTQDYQSFYQERQQQQQHWQPQGQPAHVQQTFQQQSYGPNGTQQQQPQDPNQAGSAQAQANLAEILRTLTGGNGSH